MSLRRLVAAIAVVVLAVLVAPEAIRPGFDAADAIVSIAPLALVAVILWGRSPRPSSDCKTGRHAACEESGGCDGCRARCHDIYASARAAYESSLT